MKHGPQIDAHTQMVFESLTKSYLDAIKQLDKDGMIFRAAIVTVTLPRDRQQQIAMATEDHLAEIQIASNLPSPMVVELLKSAGRTIAEDAASEMSNARPLAPTQEVAN